MKKIKLILVFLFQLTILFSQKNFSFVFLPDLHLRPDSSTLADFDRVSGQINRLKPDFALTGGEQKHTDRIINTYSPDKSQCDL
jgi:Icc protein